MKTIFEWQHLQLTATQEKQLHEQAVSPDPTQRLFTDYYSITKQMLFEDFYSACNTSKEESEFFEERQSLEEVLEKLRSDYIKDVELWLELSLNMGKVFAPYHFKVVPVNE